MAPKPERDWTTAQGYRAVVVRHDGMGHLCGYVGVPEGHPMHGKDYDDSVLSGIEVHGGLTYSGDTVPAQDLDLDGRWYLGFDCAHLGDFIPAMPREGDVERTPEYVASECERLALQLGGSNGA